jgi:uncharacterized RDD family membrane protein YckC
MSGFDGDGTKTRLFAAMFDNTIATILCVVIAARLPLPLPSAGRWLVAAGAYLFYFLVQEASWGRTLGEQIFGLRVVKINGEAAGWREALWRTVLRVVEVNPLLFGALPGGLAVTWSKRKQRLGDMLAGTVVARARVLARARA